MTQDSLTQDLVLQVLFLSESPRKTNFLATITAYDRKKMNELLHDMATQKLIAHKSGGWLFTAGPAALRAATTRLQNHALPETLSWHLGFLEKNIWTTHIDSLLAFLDGQSDTGDEAIILALELTVLFLLRVGTDLLNTPNYHQGKKFLETVVLVQLLCFSKQLYTEKAISLYYPYYELNLAFQSESTPMYMDMIKRFTDFSLSKGSIAKGMASSLLPLNKSSTSTNYAALLQENTYITLFQQLANATNKTDHAVNTQLLNVIATGLSHIAMHMRNFAISEHISNSILDQHKPDNVNGSEDGNSIFLTWLSHYCFVLLRQGKLDNALEQINILHCLDPKEPLPYASAARALALYHLFLGRVKQAHVVLTRASEYAIAHNIPHASFLDPINFDMLFIFEQQGFLPVPRYELAPTIDITLVQGSQLMQGTALRIKAMLLRAQGTNPRKVISLLQASKDKFHPERDVRELVLTLHELANTLCLVGEYAEAHQYRKIIAAHAKREITPDTSYLELAFIATCIPVDDLSLGNMAPQHHENIKLNYIIPHTTGSTALYAGSSTLSGLDEPIIGEGMHPILHAAKELARSSAFILINGETGVGKELVAEYIHKHSGRSGPFVPVHPASTSEHLFESEFFGHERGSFTGAISARKGFFEEAHNGSLFIDEVGDIPPLLQTKLLRVIQERRFLRVGSNQPIASNFRLITATNKNLCAEVKKGNFRADLLFRIAVIPLVIPPLRERRNDILPLARFYLEHFAKLYDKVPFVLNTNQELLLAQYHWPGNVRELKNLMERTTIEKRFHPDFFLYGECPTALSAASDSIFQELPSLEELERQYLLYVLNRTQGKVRGDDGAAALLGLKLPTLYAKIRRLDIRY